MRGIPKQLEITLDNGPMMRDFRHQYDRLKWITSNSRFLILPDWHRPNLASRPGFFHFHQNRPVCAIPADKTVDISACLKSCAAAQEHDTQEKNGPPVMIRPAADAFKPSVQPLDCAVDPVRRTISSGS